VFIGLFNSFNIFFKYIIFCWNKWWSRNMLDFYRKLIRRKLTCCWRSSYLDYSFSIIYSWNYWFYIYCTYYKKIKKRFWYGRLPNSTNQKTHRFSHHSYYLLPPHFHHWSLNYSTLPNSYFYLNYCQYFFWHDRLSKFPFLCHFQNTHCW
jgi:hypothetical protein